MIKQIEKKLNTGFEKALFSAILKNVEDHDNPLRLNNFAYSMRELIRHILKRLAPDKNVLSCTWYKNETSKKDIISRSERSYYSVQGGLSNTYIEEVLGIEVKETHKKLLKAIEQLNKFTHIEPTTFNLSSDDVENYSNKTIKAIFDFLTLIDICRIEIIEQLYEQIDNETVNEVLKETLDSLDVLATHYYIDEVYIDTIELYNIDHKTIFFKVIGTLTCELQWGSNGDIRHDNGHIAQRSFPFYCELVSPVEEPDAIEIIEGSLGVDTSSMYGEHHIE